ncbi:hypothetical protein FOXG_00411 [Fusarium oxysporum f. sp. lycopersici 4287]|uniref:Uncharacterized protein n=2 Tax=Fusarium oxysporum TaxID=5507 RepID=A0A0J9U667_FUSO4|nr:hypothetical protein FOXG_00411 [Fusarium oxysporum f. sp. lycopersici 4287]EXK47909.1 hypothetical protein FOMG_01103 [Fusarium oxysporum f. sp. melonis 26406]KNA94302.1 hypothetical protein FOXG_00411 [Fusarium oxysporum f. sp. lycopersici 4287]
MWANSEQRVARTLQSKYWLARCRGQDSRSTTGRDIDVILYDALRCTLQSCLDLYGFWRSSGESLDGGGEDGNKPPTGCVLAQSPCQVNPGSVRDKEELKQRSVGDEGTLCQLER